MRSHFRLIIKDALLKAISSRNAMTLIEAVVAVVLVSVIAGLAIVNFRGVILRAEARQGYIDLVALNSAQQIYKARHGQYLDFEGNCADIKDQIQQELYLTSLADNNSFCCNKDSSDGTQFECSISKRKTLTTWDYNLYVTEARIDPNLPNPGCAQGRGAPANYCPDAAPPPFGCPNGFCH